MGTMVAHRVERTNSLESDSPLANPRRRRLLRRSTLRLAVALSASLLALSGCSGLYPPPGTYTITITGQGASTGLAHTATFHLIVTP